MRTFVLVLSLATLVAPRALAQEAEAEAVEEVSTVQASTPSEDDPHAPGRIGAEIGMGFVAGLFISSAGGFVGAGLGALSCNAEYFGGCGAVGGIVGHYVVALATIPAFVTLAGSWVDGRGNAGYAYLGELVGAAAAAALLGVATAVAGDPNAGDAAPALYITAFAASVIFPLAGAIIGYELSDDAGRRSDARAQGPMLLPLVTSQGNDVSIGLAGAF